MIKKRVLILAFCLAVLPVVAILLSGCAQVRQVAEELGLEGLLPRQTVVSTGVTGTAPAGTLTPETQPPGTLTPAPPQILTIWVPPEFDPAGESEAGRLLGERLAAFSESHPEVESVQVRVKATSGISSLLDSLTAANAAAPGALPSLVALRRTDLETAALKGLIYPMDELTSSIDDPDWYPYAREMALIQGSVYGLPFAGDALLLVYRPAYISGAPQTWADILGEGKPLLFPAADPQGTVTLALYQSAGGEVRDAQNRPLIDAEVLTHVLTIYQKATQSGVFPLWLAEYQTDRQTWDSYTEGDADWTITWSSRYFSELPVDSSAVPLPSMGDVPYTVSSGWVWALADPDPAHQALSQSLADYLVESDFLADWASPSGYLPVRPTSLTSWNSNQSMRSLIGQLVAAAEVRPANDLISSVGPVLKESTVQVIQHLVAPEVQAQAASERLAIPDQNK